MTSGPRARRVIVLGSTGSIGVSTLEVIEHLHDAGLASFDVVGLAAACRAETLRAQADRFGAAHVAVVDAGKADALAGVTHVHAGPDAALELIEAVARPGDLVVAAIVGAAGLPPVLAAIDAGCDIALANKETLVAAGSLVMPRVRASGVELIPVDSEHSAIAQCLRSGRSIDEVRRIVLTASGGPFRTWTIKAIANATVEAALNHPTWSMGPKITVDSATMMNKTLEIIEAHWLFGLRAEQIEVVVHPASIVHSFVEYDDGSVLAQLSPPDMRTPIQYALTWPDRLAGATPRLDFDQLRSLSFEPVDETRFPAVPLGRAVITRGGGAGAALNAANEAAVDAFLEGRIAFPEITRVVGAALDAQEPVEIRTLADVERIGREARTFVERHARGARESLASSPRR